MDIFYIWLFIAASFAFWVLRHGRSSSAKWVVLVSAVFLAFCFSAWIWAPSHFASAGCDGDMMTGLTCPDGALLTRFAILHQTLALLGLIYFYLFVPIIFLVIGISERSARRMS